MSISDKIKTYRKQIDTLDERLLTLLEKRARLAQKIGEEKKRRGLTNFTVIEREAAILRQIRKNSTLLKPHITAIYREIISACLACEKPVSVVYLGPEGTYTHEAALKMFGHAASLTAAETIEAAIKTAEKEQCDYAIVPFENSAAGSVGATMDALLHTPLIINSEIILRIRHNLLTADKHSKPGDIRNIYAHPQALEQCRRWLKENAPRAALHPADSNAAAAALAAKKGGTAAAIGSRPAQELYRLTTIAEGIEDYSTNSTRFLILGRQPCAASGQDKTSFIMTVRDAPGAMFEVLQPFSDNNVNMVKLESRPMPDRLWEYMFFVDCIGHRDDPATAKALAGVAARAPFMKILGSYPQALS